jgi:hypothetical protein
MSAPCLCHTQRPRSTLKPHLVNQHWTSACVVAAHGLLCLSQWQKDHQGDLLIQMMHPLH